MATFISWSGEECRLIARDLKLFVSDVLGVDDVFVSDADIAAGARSLSVIEKALQDADTALVLVTADSQMKPWLNFEAGAISAKLGRPAVIPVLLDVAPSGLIQPLAQFQAISFDDRDKMLDMLMGLNATRNGGPLRERTLSITFDSEWDAFVESVRDHVSKLEKPDEAAVPQTTDKIDEVLVTIRQIANSMTSTAPRTSAVDTRMRDAQDHVERLLPDIQSIGIYAGVGPRALRVRVGSEVENDQFERLQLIAQRYLVDIRLRTPTKSYTFGHRRKDQPLVTMSDISESD